MARVMKNKFSSFIMDQVEIMVEHSHVAHHAEAAYAKSEVEIAANEKDLIAFKAERAALI